MKAIHENLERKGFTGKKEDIEFFKKFFINTEEAKNLLGFKPDLADDTIGEFRIFFEKDSQHLLIYLDEQNKLSKDEKVFLRTIAENLGINLYNAQKEKEHSSYVFV